MSTLRVNTITDALGTGNASPTPTGFSQTIQNVTASRANNTTYTNSTNKTIVVWARGTISAGTEGTGQIGGVTVWGQFAQTANTVATVVLFVPPGVTYSISGFIGISSWVELR